MKKTVFFVVCALCIGCNQSQQKLKTVSDIQLGMQIDHVQAISEKGLIQIGENREVIQYRGWFYDGSEKKSIWGTIPLSQKPKPYILTFNVEPELQKGNRVGSLVKIQLDEDALMLEAMDRQTDAINTNGMTARERRRDQ